MPLDRPYRLLWIALVVFVLDQASKFMAQAYLAEGDLVLFPVLRFHLAYNTGAAFSFLNDAGGWQHYFFTAMALVVSGAILYWVRTMSRDECQSVIALFLIMGGALANALDRLRLGKVVDFIMVHYQDWVFPIFNLADSAITIGAALFLLDSFGVRLFRKKVTRL